MMWRAGEISPMMSCIALAPKRNECLVGVRHRFEAKEKLWLNETWLPLRNSQSSKGERYRHNEVRWAAHPSAEKKHQKHCPQVLPASLTEMPWWQGTSQLNNSLQEKETRSQEMNTSQFRHQWYKFQLKKTTTVKCGKACILESRQYSHLAPEMIWKIS